MIRELETQHIESIMKIWLDTNIKAHDFITEKYWIDNLETVKTMLPQAEVYLYDDEKTNEIQGFIGVIDECIEGIFVRSEMQSKGIGKQLLDYIKFKKIRLNLRVYQKNERALNFYFREGFKVQSKGIDENTKEPEYIMVWER